MKTVFTVPAGLLASPAGLAQLRELLETNKGRLQVEAPTGLTLFERLEELFDTLEELATPSPAGFEYKEERLTELGHALEDWLKSQDEGFDLLGLMDILLEWDIPRSEIHELESWDDLEITIVT
jgi:hypothetical protein